MVMIDIGDKTLRVKIIHNNDGTFYKEWECPCCQTTNIENDGSKVVFCQSEECKKNEKDTNWYIILA